MVVAFVASISVAVSAGPVLAGSALGRNPAAPTGSSVGGVDASAWPWIWQTQLPAPGYGVAVSANGRTVITGSPYASVDGRSEAGQVDVWRFSDSSWSVQASLDLGNSAANDDWFGASVALGDDGNTALVGAPGRAVNGQEQAGAAEVYRFTGGRWAGPTELSLGSLAQGAAGTAGGDSLGSSIALSSDGGTAAVGARGRTVDGHQYAGAVYVFSFSGTWSRPVELSRGSRAEYDDSLGQSVAISADGGVVVAGGIQGIEPDARPGSPAAFRLGRSGWSQAEELSLGSSAGPDDQMGLSVALSSDGDTALVGAPDRDAGGVSNVGAGEVFRFDGTKWTWAAELTENNPAVTDSFGQWVALSGDGRTALIGAPGRGQGSGGADMFTSAADVWSAPLSLPAGPLSGRLWGFTVALSRDGGTALVGSPESGTYDVYAPLPANDVLVTVNVSASYGSRPPLSAIPAANPGISYFPSEEATGVSGSLTCGTDATNLSHPGSYKIFDCHGLAEPGRTMFYDYGHSAYVVTPAAPILRWVRPSTITYGTSLSGQQLDPTALGVDGKALPGTFAYSPAAGTFLHAGPAQKLKARFTPDNTTDYASVRTVSTTIDVSPASLTITARNRTVTRGGSLFPLPWRTNFVADNTRSSLTAQPVCSADVTTDSGRHVSSPVGTYPITCTGAVDPDYTISYSPGTLTVVALSSARLAYTGPTSVTQGANVSLSAKLTTVSGSPITGRALTMQIGEGGHIQACHTHATNAGGVGSCTIKNVKAHESPAPVKYHFAGDNPDSRNYRYGPAHGVTWVTIVKRAVTQAGGH